ncbi:hypothetical protein [Streptomyces dangxiongensis]|uniref:hypothetical protein n=1 Tax=Streptomyces dangxiongensis TaxID=1442032 RepID=UPI001969ED65|nr:hypothetical protein [Streptomyces dangxiongensis]
MRPGPGNRSGDDAGVPLSTATESGTPALEDRRPNANVDPYAVTRLSVDTCCAAPERAGQV